MASNYTGLGVQLMTTGEKAGTWGTLTNTNWGIIEQISGGYTTQAVTDGADTALSVSDGSTGATLAHRIIELTGSLSAGRNVTIPLDVQTFYVIKNATSGSQVVTFKYTSGSGSSVAIANGETVLIYATANDGTNPDIVDTGFGSGISAVVDDTTPQLGGDLDVNGNDIVSVSNADISIIPNGTGDVNLGADTVQVGDLNANATITTQGTGDLILNTNNGTNSGNVTVADGANGDITITPDGTGIAKAVDSADATGAIKIAGLETMWVPASAMYATTTNPAEAAQVETTALRPDMKVFDFADTADDFVQFSVAMSKSWNLGVVTYQVFWTPSTTNTGNCIFGLQGVACGDSDTIDIAFGTAVDITDAGIGTVEDQQVSPVSGDVTIAGSPADNQQTYFQLYRDANAGGDTYTGVARVLGVKIFYTTDAANDA
jgi:hypothetical protein